MVPAAVQTKHSVTVYATLAPAASTHFAIEGPCTPSLSPMMITFFPVNQLLTMRPPWIRRKNLKT
jgi:hypothetical protein